MGVFDWILAIGFGMFLTDLLSYFFRFVVILFARKQQAKAMSLLASDLQGAVQENKRPPGYM